MANYATYSTLDGLLLDELYRKQHKRCVQANASMILTVDLCNSIRQDFFLHLLVLQALEHVGNDSLCELSLLVLLSS